MSAKKTEVQMVLERHLEELKFCPVREFQFNPARKWRADYYFEVHGPRYTFCRYLLEIEGGAFTQGRHTRGKGFIADMEKYNMAAILGYRVLRFTPQQILSGEAKEFLKKWLG